nr:ketosamine-3-kinase [Quercus suber]
MQLFYCTKLDESCPLSSLPPCLRRSLSYSRFVFVSEDLAGQRGTLAMLQLDSAVAALLGLDPSSTSVTNHGGGGMSSAATSKIVSQLPSGETKQFFMKEGPGIPAEIMFKGEHASLNAIHDVVPTLCPRSLGYGRCADTPNRSFLVTDFLEVSGSSGSRQTAGMSLARKLAKLHTTPAPTPEGYDRPQFGFPTRTCCGDTPQDNTYSSSWEEFFTNSRLRFILARAIQSNGEDRVLSTLVDEMCNTVIPRLIGDEHLNNGLGVMPAVVHGDLWSGNASVGTLLGMSEPEDLVFDSSASYAHSEFELGIMNMFGGFGGSFLEEYHALVPKTEPVEEYDDRVLLYQLYHTLNHFALFGGGYRTSSITIMNGLIRKYGGF